MTDKQRRFAEEYLVDLNATQAAIRAGYSGRTARSIGRENLTKPDIQQYISARQAEARARVEVTQEEILLQLKKIGLSDVDAEDIKVADKLKAMDMMIRMLGYDKPQNEIADGGGVVVLPSVMEDG